MRGGGDFSLKIPPPPTKSNRDLDLKILKRERNIFFVTHFLSFIVLCTTVAQFLGSKPEVYIDLH